MTDPEQQQRKDVMKIIFLVIVFVLGIIPSVHAEVFTVLVKETGFFTEDYRHINPQHPVKVPANTIITVRLKFDEKANSFAAMDTHQIDLINTTTEEVSSLAPVWWFSPNAYMALATGEPGTIHRGYCMVECLGMSQLRNLILMAE